MEPIHMIVAVTGHDKPRQHLLERAESLGREAGAAVLLLDRGADLGPLMSALPTSYT